MYARGVVYKIDSSIDESRDEAANYNPCHSRAYIPSTIRISTLVRGVDRGAYIGQTSNLQRAAAIAATRRTHIVSMVAVVAA